MIYDRDRVPWKSKGKNACLHPQIEWGQEEREERDLRDKADRESGSSPTPMQDTDDCSTVTRMKDECW